MENKVAQIITDRITEQLEKGIIPWQKPWKGNKAGMFPCYSYSTGKPYDIMNQILLDFVAGDYITFQQCQKAGGKVKKGAESKVVIGWVVTSKERKDADGNVLVNEDGETLKENHFGLRYYRVFNVLDCEGINPKHDFSQDEQEEGETLLPDEKAEQIINDYLARETNLKFRPQNTDNAYYSPSQDMVVVPELAQFENIAEYYSTAFHELTHSTMKASRCDREQDRKGKNVAFGSETYSKEELVAEIGAACLVNISGLENEHSFRNSVGYIQSWLKALKNDPTMIIYASARADKAVNYILGAE